MFLNTIAISSNPHKFPLPIAFLHRMGETNCVIVEKYLFFVLDDVPIPCFKLCLQVLAFSNGISHRLFLNCSSNSENVKDAWTSLKPKQNFSFQRLLSEIFLKPLK